jgi:hypothetical protein
MAATRLQKMRMARHEELRNKFKGNEYIRQLAELGNDLVKLDADVKKAKAIRTVEKDSKGNKVITFTAPDLVLEKAKVRCKIIQSRIDLNFRRLKKLLPDEAMLEITDPDGNNPFAQIFAGVVRGTED